MTKKLRVGDIFTNSEGIFEIVEIRRFFRGQVIVRELHTGEERAVAISSLVDTPTALASQLYRVVLIRLVNLTAGLKILAGLQASPAAITVRASRELDLRTRALLEEMGWVEETSSGAWKYTIQ